VLSTAASSLSSEMSVPSEWTAGSSKPACEVLHISATKHTGADTPESKRTPSTTYFTGIGQVAQLCQIVVSAPQQVEARPVPLQSGPIMTQLAPKRKKDRPTACPARRRRLATVGGRRVLSRRTCQAEKAS
jgi:hypothetical protein